MPAFRNYEREIAKLPEGPPSPNEMDYLVIALLWDGKPDRAFAAADDMISHYINRGDDHWSRNHGFAYWLGVRGTIQTIIGVRTVAREDRAWQRQMRAAKEAK